jgi:hypothetical protein
MLNNCSLPFFCHQSGHLPCSASDIT